MITVNRELLARIWYPLVMTVTLVLHYLLIEGSVTLVYATYIPVLLAATWISLLEYRFPFAVDWKPDHIDVVNDSTYMIVVQILLPQFLAYLAAVTFAGMQQFSSSLWPRDLPVVVQVILMILLADFLRYWLHRASHNFMPLWQLHAVHHSPRKLYWLNVGRFHPIEKALQFLFDALPFILLGIDQSVLSWYFVFYAVNGFFQHSNVNVRLGLLNYIISGAELHRWHHSMKVAESNNNYGNNVIIWDILFGTWFLPKDAQVAQLGLVNRTYPTRFIDQMKTPFIPRMDKLELPLIPYREIVVNILLKFRLAILYISGWSTFILATHYPYASQMKLLRRIIAENRNTDFGREHRFAGTRSYRQFVTNCPVQDYESLSEYIRLDTERQGLTARPARFFNVTSATTGSAKYLPMTDLGLENDKRLQNMVALCRYMENPATYTGKMFAIVSPAIEGRLPSGVPFGSASGLTYQNMPAMSRLKYVVPYRVFEIADYDARYCAIALFGLIESRVSIAATANPSTLVRLLEIINTHFTAMFDCMKSGDFSRYGLTAELQNELRTRLRENPLLPESLNRIWMQKGRLGYRDIWPNLQTLVTWTGGSCGIALSALKPDLPDNVKIAEMGYLSSEFRGTITLDYSIGVPALTYSFLEFAGRDDWEAGNRETLLLHQLEVGRHYYVIVTTVNGLYRYFMNDIIEVTGKFHRTPTIRFVQKGRGVTSITGEKLYEGQVLEAIKALGQHYQLAVRFFQCLADEAAAGYTLYLELAGPCNVTVPVLAQSLDDQLSRYNIEYKHKRASGRLHPPEVLLLKPGTGEQHKKFHLARGQREGQYKALTLCYLRDSAFPFADYLLMSD